MPHAEVNGQRLYHEVHGHGEPLLCVMGLGADALGLALQVPEWSKHFRTVVFDNRDVGRSSYADGDYEMMDMARDTLRLATTSRSTPSTSSGSRWAAAGALDARARDRRGARHPGPGVEVAGGCRAHPRRRAHRAGGGPARDETSSVPRS
ncbi:MAG: alpha/beta fold hydrolase [Thermoleophilaceae bacterium]